ncbi:MAG: DUF2752 domain-containing protein [Rhodopirellula sp.]|nr:DUF2752 domain-containing protein [Rhodopirellula sp.]
MDVVEPDQQKQRNHHRVMLAIYATVVVLMFLLQVRNDQRVEFYFLPGIPFPESCFSRSLFGIDCPGCGLTRSFIYLAAGRVIESFSANRIGWLLMVAVLIQFPYRMMAIRHIDRGQEPPFVRWHTPFSAVLIVALISNWLLKTIGY